MKEIMVKLRFLHPSLPRAEKAVARYLLDNPATIPSMTLAILSQEAGSSEASVVRFCRKLGFDGFTSLKQAFLIELVDTTPTMSVNIRPDDSMEEILKKVIQDNINTLNDTLALTTSDWEGALNALVNARSVHFFGTGDAHAVCQLACVKFSRLGIVTSAHSDTSMMLITSASLKEGDAAVAVSYSGSTRTTIQAMKAAKEAGAATICITRMNKSSLLRYTDHNLYIATTDQTVSRELLSRRIADQAIMDALYLGVLVRRGKEAEEWLRRTQKAIDNDKL